MDQSSKGSPRNYLQDRQNDGLNYAGSSPFSASELALRVALCDLVERLKRSEQTCKYLEQCRNELAKEVIKLRQENMIITRENSISSAIIQNELLSRRNSDAEYSSKYKQNSSSQASRQEIEMAEAKQRQALTELELLKNNTESEESWEEITIRLLKQLREEMKTPQAIANAEAKPNTVTTSENVSSDVGSNRSIHRPRIYLTQTTINSAPDVNRKPKQEPRDSQNKRTATSEHHIDTNSEQYLSYQVQENRNPLKSVIKVTSDLNDSKDNSSAVSVRQAGTKDKATIDFCAKVISALTSDLDILGRRLSGQNEKLTKLKNKQLRTYFRRQLNDDHIVIQTNAKTHLEHV